MSDLNDIHALDALAGFTPSESEARSPLWLRFTKALEEELRRMREQNDHPTNIVDTTVLRGEIRLVKRILARTPEVGPESRQSEPLRPESAFDPLARVIPRSNER